jgi:hypothetical protein
MSRTRTSPFLHIKTFICVDTVKYQIHINQRYLSRPVMDSSLVFGNALQIPPSVSTGMIKVLSWAGGPVLIVRTDVPPGYFIV